MEVLAFSRGWRIKIFSLDVEVDARPLFSLPSEPNSLLRSDGRKKRGLWSRRSTWSKSLYRGPPGPPPLRSAEHPYGFPWLTGYMKKKKKCDLGTTLFRACVRILLAVGLAGGAVFIEHPADPGGFYPSIWRTSEMDQLREIPGFVVVLMHQCMFGAPTVKPTMMGTDCPGAAEALGKKCNHGFGAHQRLEGFDEQGGFRTSKAQAYPAHMCEVLATLLILGAAAAECKPGRRILTPPMSEKRVTLSRWRTEFKGRWSKEEHINALELRTIVNLVRHLARSQKCWGHKVLCFTDSMVALGAAGKGRSSAPSLLALCRRLCALRLITCIRIYLRHDIVPSELNHADGPSRGGACGCDEETVKKHANRIETRRGQG